MSKNVGIKVLCLFCSCMFVWNLIAYCCGEGENRKYLVTSVYVADINELRDSPHQALLLIDLESHQIADCIEIVDGSTIIEDSGRIYSVCHSSYGLIHSSSYSFSRTRCYDLYSVYSIHEKKIEVEEQWIGNTDYEDIVLKFIGNDVYVLKETEGFSFQLNKQQNTGNVDSIDLGTFFDFFHAWNWPCEIISVNNNGVTALMRYDSWGDTTILGMADFHNMTIRQVDVGNARGPICWQDEKILLLWEQGRDGNYTLLKYNSIDDDLLKYHSFSKIVPIACMASSDNEVAFWAYQDNEKDKLCLMTYSEQEDIDCILEFNNRAGNSIYEADVTYDGKKILIPLREYQPVILYVY